LNCDGVTKPLLLAFATSLTTEYTAFIEAAFMLQSYEKQQEGVRH